MDLLDFHLKKILQNPQRLHDNNPECLINFLVGNPGATALLHMRQLSLVGMISRNKQNICYEVASHLLLTEPDNSSSWFVSIRQLFATNNLPSALSLLIEAPTKAIFKTLIKKKIIDYWQEKFRCEAAALPSLPFFIFISFLFFNAKAFILVS